MNWKVIIEIFVVTFGLLGVCKGFGLNKDVINVTYKATSAVFLNITKPKHEDMEKRETVTVVIGLFDKEVPITTENFRKLVTGELGMGYNGSSFHRIIAGFMIQGGDYERGDGTGGKSIYKDEFGSYSFFDDENFKIEHSAEGFVSMANAGPHTNGAQFFITVNPAPWLDEQHVVFGKVLKGQEYIHEISFVQVDRDHKPKYPVIISSCGIWKLDKPVDVNSTVTTYKHLEL